MPRNGFRTPAVLARWNMLRFAATVAPGESWVSLPPPGLPHTNYHVSVEGQTFNGDTYVVYVVEKETGRFLVRLASGGAGAETIGFAVLYEVP